MVEDVQCIQIILRSIDFISRLTGSVDNILSYKLAMNK